MKEVKGLSPEDQLKLMRSGYNATLELVVGELKIPCRILQANEEASAIAQAKQCLKVPSEEMRETFESIEVQKQVLEKAACVDGTPYINRRFLDLISAVELEALYNQYQTLVRTADPEFEKLTPEQIAEFCRAIKKKEATTKSLFTWQLAEIGRYFLDVILPAGSEAGS